MKTKFQKVIVLFLAACLLSSCATFKKTQKRSYGILKSAVTFSSEKVIGEYGDQIPVDFDSQKFLKLMANKIPEEYFRALKKHKLEVEPRHWYYLIKVFDGNDLILFDYSCTTELDGPVQDSPEKYDPADLEKYNQCR